VTAFVKLLSVVCGVLPALVLMLGGWMLIHGAVTGFLSYPDVYLNDPHRGVLLIATLLLCVTGIFGFIGLVSVVIGGRFANRTTIRFLWLGVISAAAGFALLFGPDFFTGDRKDSATALALWGLVFLGPVVVGLFHISQLKRMGGNGM